ncbi:MAG: hypothetical protein C0623_11900 [Desulfuromonas sp.]|nr:MAG: hypothetical protein C0623_11900 [Desulfuromonas sp.]
MITKEYAKRYAEDKTSAVYPVEFVVRAFLGNYPATCINDDNFEGKKILDIGYGDGRNMPLLNNIGMEIHGIEIADEINQHVRDRLDALGINATLKKGANANIPYEDGFFNYVLACHACYYVEQGDTFDTNLDEISRVLEPGGKFIASLAMTGSYILKDAKQLDPGHYEITNDPYGLRNGTIFRAFDSEIEIKEALSPFFNDIVVGYCDDLFWGLHQKVWTVICKKK